MVCHVRVFSGNAWDDPYIQAARVLVDEALLTAQSEEGT